MRTAIKIHSLPFHDHDGNASAMVFWAPADQPLPPLYSFAIYVTTLENTSPESFNAVELLQALNTSRYAPETTGYRLDIYFRPGSSVDECKQHYNAEKAARGTYADHLKKVRNGGGQSRADNHTEGTQRLPGLVPSYLRPPSFCHHDVLFIIDSPDWRSGADLRMVEFRPAEVPSEFDPDPEELEEAPDMVAPTRTRAFPVCPDPEAYDGGGTVQGRMYDMFLIKEEQLSDPYEQALELGWTSW